MKFREKLLQLIGDRSRTSVAAAAGIPVSVLTTYLNRGSEPSAVNALKLARALDVDLEWLIDEDAQSTPITRHATSRLVTDDELVEELGNRMHQIGAVLLPKLFAAENIAWYEVGLKLADADPGMPLPDDLREQATLPFQLAALADLTLRYDPRKRLAGDSSDELLAAANARGREGMYSLTEIHDRHEVLRNSPGYMDVVSLMLTFWSGQITGKSHRPWPSPQDKAKLLLAKQEFQRLAQVDREQERHIDESVEDMASKKSQVIARGDEVSAAQTSLRQPIDDDTIKSIVKRASTKRRSR